jgi:subfamily B ATP-binding cassette protein MsbA
LALIFISLFSGFSESFGIALFMPILTATNITAASTDRVSIFFNNFFQLLGFTPSLYLLFGLVFLVFLFRGVIKFIECAYTAHLTALMTNTVRKHVVELFGAMDYRFYIDRDTGYFSNLMIMETSRMVVSFTRFCAVIVNIITVSVFILVSFWVNWQFTLATIMFSAVVLYSFKSISALARRYSLAVSHEYADLHSMLIQSLHAFKYIKATFSFKTVQDKLFRTTGNISRLQYQNQLFGGILSALSEPLVIFFILALMAWQVGVLQQSLAPLVVSIMLFYRISQYVLGLQAQWQQFSSFAGGVETVTAASADIQRLTEPAGMLRYREQTESIEFRNVAFSYAARDVLHDISFTINRNDMVAFVGESGIGKTTLVDIITGVLVPHQGEVRINQHLLQEIAPADWRSRIGYVTQEPVLFNDTVSNNICFWAGNPAEPQLFERIQDSARQAYCDRFIRELPSSYDSIIGDRGIKLSAGQRQRLAIARELFKQPELLILDEATSALDSESELFIQQSIHELKGKLTVLLIAHRLSTIRYADYIYVLSSGRIIEHGTFKSLLAAENSRFSQMCRMQNIHDV